MEWLGGCVEAGCGIILFFFFFTLHSSSFNKQMAGKGHGLGFYGKLIFAVLHQSDRKSVV